MDPTLSAAIVLGGYAESLVDGRRVAVFGDASVALPEELVERGARVVNVYDPAAPRAAEAAAKNRSSQVSVLSLEGADIAVRDGAFDVAIVPDLSLFDAPDKLVRRIRRALTPRGVVIVASPNPESRFSLVPRTSGRGSGPTYYELFDLVSAEFPEVRMLGQTPFVGYAVVDFAPEGEPEVSLDSELVPGGAEEPEWFVAVASAAPVEVEAFSIVQLPAARVLSPRVSDETLGELRAARDRESELLGRVATLEAQVAKKKEAKVAPPPPPPETPAVDPERERALEQEIRERDARIAELASRAEAAAHRADAAIAEVQALGDAQKRAGRLESERAELARKLDEAAKEKTELEKRLAEATAEKERIERKLAQREADVARLTAAAAADGPDDVARLESALTERGERVRKLESDLREAERVGKELVRELGARGRVSDQPAQPENGALSSENARLRADVEALGWTIEELEGRLLRSSSGPR